MKIIKVNKVSNKLNIWRSFKLLFILLTIIFMIEELFWMYPSNKKHIYFSHGNLKAFVDQTMYSIHPNWSNPIDITITAEEYYSYNTRYCKGHLVINGTEYSVSSKQFHPRSVLGHIIDRCEREKYLPTMLPAEFTNYIFVSDDGAIDVCVSEYDAQVYYHKNGLQCLYN